jgi:membrane protein DedA with SNARE-associated domain/rhodanese-related sulfurtransferase
MEFLLSGVTEHGYSIVMVMVFLETVGLPIPAALALLVAGGASGQGALDPTRVVAGALTAMMLGDTLMFFVGRRTGWWLLGLLCRISLNPESCILRSADSFYRRGRLLLVFAKFVPGINTMAPPLAGSMNMRFAQFFGLDLAGASLYVGFYLAIGFLLSDVIGVVTSRYQALNRWLGGIVLVLVAGYLGLQVWMWIRAHTSRDVSFVSPSEAARACASDAAVIYDVRSHGYFDAHATRIQGSIRLDPTTLDRFSKEPQSDQPVYLYCTCVREATSSRVARMLRERGVRSVVIKGGLQSWKRAGLPVEPVPADDLVALPIFS